MKENPISFDGLLWKHQPKNVYYGGPDRPVPELLGQPNKLS